jgi:16S rRNA (adenine1518-N6/adenine1519-N6)-dimethyltransferase
VSNLPRANKELGQHFLRDQRVIKGICTDFIEQCDVIVEVGPGPAVLTQHLAQIDKPFYVIEMDQRFKEHLLEYVNDENIFMQDALKFDWDQFIIDKNLQGKKIWLVSNLPYNVGTVLFTNFLAIDQIKYMTLMFQKEVGDKTYTRQGKNLMNGLLFLSLNYFSSKRLLKVSPGAFVPPPKVESVVVSYERNESPKVKTEELNKLNQFTRSLFSFKRKQIGSVLKGTYGKERVQKALLEAQIDTKVRAESLSQNEIYRLFFALNT